MLNLARRAAAAAAAALVLVFLAQGAALAGGAPESSPFGYTQCGQEGQPSCTVTAGTDAASGTPASASTSGAAHRLRRRRRDARAP